MRRALAAGFFILSSRTRAGALGLPLRHFENFFSGPESRSIWKWLRRIAIAALVVGAPIYEIRTSALQSRILSYYARKLSYSVQPGPSPRIHFPKGGPFDTSRGYSRIADFQRRLEQRGFRVTEQSRFSAELEWIASLGIAPPYREQTAAGLVVRGYGGAVLHQAAAARLFGRYEDIPPIIARSLIEMENRELAESPDGRNNPVVEWDRLARASLLYAVGKLGIPVPREGGSTLATQLEKYRHSNNGRTASFSDKLQQMTGASLKVYREGRDTTTPRREIVLDYLNTVPLAAVPGYGELHGLGDGLKGWFGLDLDQVCRDLRSDDPGRRARAFKPVLALLASMRGPTRYLVHDRNALDARMRLYTGELAARGVIDADLARRVDETPLRFDPAPSERAALQFEKRKAATAVRTQLLDLLGVGSLYDLDRLHLDLESTIDVPLQNHVVSLFGRLHDRSFVASHGLVGERLLGEADPANVVYSLVLFERTPMGNALRVNADTLDQPFDVNNGLKLELGSTAKLRTLAHYLELVAGLHGELAHAGAARIQDAVRAARDPITAWAAETLVREPGVDLEAFLVKALERRYSASPGEAFFTAGGMHTFANFDSKDNGRIMSVREATRQSTNLVFIRLMRDLVRYHQARLPYDAEAVLADPNHPERRRMLGDMADAESDQILAKAYRSYQGLDASEVMKRLTGEKKRSARELALLYLAWHAGAAAAGDLPSRLQTWSAEQGVEISSQEAGKLARAYGDPRLMLLDYAYLLRRHPLDLACAGALIENPSIGWSDLRARTAEARQAASSWLLGTRHRTAQDLRLRIHIEQDAFARMTPYWRRLGFPFAHLTPSYATAIGNSSDRPIALAELMGILTNDGVAVPTIRMKQVRFAEGTPYHTVLEPNRSAGERVMAEPVARVLRSVLAEVVQGGTAQRAAGAFRRPDGTPIVVGGKTGSGDNRFETYGRHGQVLSARAVNRTAAFVFYIGDKYFGVLLAYVPGEQAARYHFTSSLPVAILRLLAPQLNPYLQDEQALIAQQRAPAVPPPHRAQPVS